MSGPIIPIFIGGCPRSGTTLLGTLLGAHPRAVVTPESQFKANMARRAAANGGTLRRREVAIGLRTDFRYSLWRSGWADSHAAGPDDGAAVELTALLSEVVRAYGAERGVDGAEYWIDHTPANLREAHLLLDVFPEAHFVHIIRDGRSVASSVIPLDWGPNTALSAAEWWVRQTGDALAGEDHVRRRTGRVHRVRFEDLVNDPASVVGALAAATYGPGAFADWGNAVSATFDVPRYTVSQHRLIGKAPDRSKASLWRTQLSAAQVAAFEYVAGDCLANLGYERDRPDATRPGLVRRMRARVEELPRRYLNVLRRILRLRAGRAGRGGAPNGGAR